jgi:hypothetical protein
MANAHGARRGRVIAGGMAAVITVAGLLAAAVPEDWRSPDPENTLYLELDAGQVVIELAPRVAPEHAANVRRLVRQRYFDGLAIVRAQDNYVVQWGDPDNERSLRRSNPGCVAIFADCRHALHKAI